MVLYSKEDKNIGTFLGSGHWGESLRLTFWLLSHFTSCVSSSFSSRGSLVSFLISLGNTRRDAGQRTALEQAQM
jgi:hypothetical protein